MNKVNVGFNMYRRENYLWGGKVGGKEMVKKIISSNIFCFYNYYNFKF